MLTLRTSIGLSQEGLAAALGITRKTIGRWEAGERYPKAEHLQALLALALQHGVFAAGEEEEAIRAFWRAAHQKVLLDETWLHKLLNPPAPPRRPSRGEQTRAADPLSAPPCESEPRVDWDEALDVPSFYGRKAELALLSRWIGEERCRVVSVLGMGGIGKSALAITVMQQVARQFEVVIWRSLRDRPTCATLVQSCLQVLDPQGQPPVADALEDRLRLLMEQLRTRRVLLVLDNWETLLEEGTDTGRLHAGAEGYARLLHQVGATRHQSCLLLTSREKPADLVPLEGNRSPVRTLRLAGLEGPAGAQVLSEKEVVGSPQDLGRLVELYQGNPLALKIVAQTIVELFGGEIVPFLEQGEVIFGGVRQLLDEQFERLSQLEEHVLSWLAILREPVHLSELHPRLVAPKSMGELLEAVDGLLRRSLIESGHRAGSFTLQSVVLEYATARLIAQASCEIEQGRLANLLEYGLCQAQAKEYMRETQERLLVVPLLTRLRSTYRRQADLEARLLSLLDDLRSWDHLAQGYGPANLVALLQVIRGHLHGLDLSRLSLHGAFLHGVQMQDADLSGARLQDCVFTEPFDAIAAVATSKSGQYWAAATWRGEVRVWAEAGQTLQQIWQAHIASGPGLVFSPDGRRLATGGWDNTVKLWDIESGTLLWTSWQTNSVRHLAFGPDGCLLAGGGGDATIRIWDATSGTLHQTLTGQSDHVHALAWNPDRYTLASSYSDGSIWVWEPQKGERGTHVQTLADGMTGLAFSPDGTQLASASPDGTIKLWDTESFDCLQTFSGHTDQVLRVVWSPDGHTLASVGLDKTIRLWDVKESRSRVILHGHSAAIYAIAFTPDSRTLLSGSNDGTIRVWNVDRGQCLRIIGGFVASLFDIDWSPDGTQLASGGADTMVTIWDTASTTSSGILRGHRWIVRGVAWSPDGRLLASGGLDNSIRLWDTVTGVCLQVLRDPDAVDTIFQGVAWSPDGTWVVGGGDDGHVYVWDASDGTLLRRLVGYHGAVMSVAWSPDGMRLASAGGGREGGELFVWDAQSGEQVQALAEHPGVAFALAWSPSGEQLISGGSDGMLRWWEVQSGHCVQVREAHQGAVQALKVSPDGSRLASCGDDGAIVLWDLHTGEPLQTLRRDRPYERLNITGIRSFRGAKGIAASPRGVRGNQRWGEMHARVEYMKRTIRVFTPPLVPAQRDEADQFLASERRKERGVSLQYLHILE